MTQLLKVDLKEIYPLESLSEKNIASVLYHDIFDYPLTAQELIRWEAGRRVTTKNKLMSVDFRNGFYFLGGREASVLKRLLRKRISSRKLRIARKAGQILQFIPFVKGVFVTGALAMGNAAEDSDIDLLLITQKGRLWTSRLLCLVLLKMIGFPVRKFGDKNQKDKLCLNMWLDGSDLVWSKEDRNCYTAHEIAQIVPLVNKDNSYERLIWENKWVRAFWPNAVRAIKQQSKVYKKGSFIGNLFESWARKIQFIYMRRKITREIVTPTRALFHPHDWGGVVLSRFAPR